MPACLLPKLVCLLQSPREPQLPGMATVFGAGQARGGATGLTQSPVILSADLLRLSPSSDFWKEKPRTRPTADDAASRSSDVAGNRGMNDHRPSSECRYSLTHDHDLITLLPGRQLRMDQVPNISRTSLGSQIESNCRLVVGGFVTSRVACSRSTLFCICPLLNVSLSIR